MKFSAFVSTLMRSLFGGPDPAVAARDGAATPSGSRTDAARTPLSPIAVARPPGIFMKPPCCQHQRGQYLACHHLATIRARSRRWVVMKHCRSNLCRSELHRFKARNSRTVGGYRIVGPLMLLGRGSLTASLEL